MTTAVRTTAGRSPLVEGEARDWLVGATAPLATKHGARA